MKSNRIWPACLLAAFVFGACSVDKPVSSNDSGVISFRATVPFATKASSVTTANIGEFHVTAIGNNETFFEAEHVSVSGAGVCTMDKSYYWPAYELGFYAYANTSGGTASIANAAKGIAGVTPVAAAADQKDFVVAYKTGTKANDMASGVALNFRHALSQVVVKAKNLSTSGLKINVKGVKVANVKSSGDFTFPAAVTDPHDGGTLDFALWNSSSASKGAYTIGGASETAIVLDGTAKDIMFSGASWMLIPQQLVAWDLANDKANANNNAFIGVYVQILDAADNQLYPATAGEYAYANVPVDTKWEPGKTYTYTLNFLDEANGGGAGVDDNGDPVLGNPIAFTLTVDDWNEQFVQLRENGINNVITLTAHSTGGSYTQIPSNELLSISNNSLECQIPTIDNLTLELTDVSETVIPATKFTLSRSVVTPTNNEFTLTMDQEKPNELEFDTEYRGPDLIVKNEDNEKMLSIGIKGKYNGPSYLTFTILEDGNISFKYFSSIATSTVSIDYKKNDGEWTTITPSKSGVLLPVQENDIVKIKGNNNSYDNGLFCNTTTRFKLSGNIMSLFDGNNFENINILPGKLRALFAFCSGLTSASELSLPATTLADYCYEQMFSSCTSLTSAPELPATTLTEGCYALMFSGCNSLTSAPELPATTLTYRCYDSMFSSCSLTSAPELPATTLAERCYEGMFSGCTSLTTAPELPATTLAERCYNSMFNYCTSLTSAPELPATTLAERCYDSMFSSCTSLTSAPELPATTLAERCYEGMFSGCTSLTTAPELPATTSASSCYKSMFYGCTGLTSAPELPATTLAELCYDSMFYGCTGLTSAPALPATTSAIGCYKSMFYGCTSLTTAPELPATTSASSCYKSMFYGCTSLTSAPELPATILAERCYEAMFYGCTGLSSAPALPATTLAEYCYTTMFYGCTGLTSAPNLPATTLTKGCYNSMFYGCTNLNYIKAGFTTTPSTTYTNNWVNKVASHGTFIKNAGATWNVRGQHGIPSGWTVQNAAF